MYNINSKLGFCSFCRSGAFLLQADLVDHECQRGDGSQECAENLSDESILGGKLTEALELFGGQDGAFYEAALDFQNVLVLLGKFANDTSRSDGVTGGDGERSGAVEQLIKLGVAGLVGGEASQSVLHDGVLNTGFTELVTQCGILCDSDALVIDENCGSSVLQLFGQSINNCLLAFKYLDIGQCVSPPKKILMPKDMRTQKSRQKILCNLGRPVRVRVKPPAVFGNLGYYSRKNCFVKPFFKVFCIFLKKLGMKNSQKISLQICHDRV